MILHKSSAYIRQDLERSSILQKLPERLKRVVNRTPLAVKSQSFPQIPMQCVFEKRRSAGGTFLQTAGRLQHDEQFAQRTISKEVLYVPVPAIMRRDLPTVVKN